MILAPLLCEIYVAAAPERASSTAMSAPVLERPTTTTRFPAKSEADLKDWECRTVPVKDGRPGMEGVKGVAKAPVVMRMRS